MNQPRRTPPALALAVGALRPRGPQLQHGPHLPRLVHVENRVPAGADLFAVLADPVGEP
ncbi:hypothetical protein [Streptomyces chrestomyceticus]|uniref:hypothetical protein n=1 Tax=Streptomyces chrestomyceticus TaxID=68185 RepID=UPI0037A00452